MSLDGYIATATGDISFLSSVEEEGEDYGYKEFLETIDTIIIGRKTYDKVVSMGFEYPHNDKDVYIITRSPQAGKGIFKYYSGDLRELILKLKSSPGKNIFCDGGAEIANALMNEKLIDEIVLSIVPVILGDGIRLFRRGSQGMNLRLTDSLHFNKGLVQLHYTRAENSGATG